MTTKLASRWWQRTKGPHPDGKSAKPSNFLKVLVYYFSVFKRVKKVGNVYLLKFLLSYTYYFN